jgi:tetratricopeptide (TPR) repeat protein
MDYATFTDAFGHNRRAQQHLLNILSTRVDNSPEFALFLGAGASVTSGVEAASQMISDWQRRLFASYKGPAGFKHWLTDQEWHQVEDEYPRLFELVYDQPSQRRAYIENAVRKARPSWGYAYLVSLIKRGVFNVVFTTNFDDLVNDACYNFTNDMRPMVCAHDSAVSSVRLMSERPKVIKLHGDFLYDSIKNTSSELQSLEANMRDKFIEFAKQYGLVVVGYSGGDQSVMDLLDVLVRSDTYFRNGIYWCVMKGSCPGRRMRQLLRNDRVFWVEVDGFDELMADIASSASCGLPEAVVSPHASALHRSKHLLNVDLKSAHPGLNEALSRTKEVYQRIQGALEEVGLEGWDLDEKKDTMGDLIENYLPVLGAMHLAGQKKWEEACNKLMPLVENSQSTGALRAWDVLLDCLLHYKEGHSEASRLIGLPPHQTWQNSSHYLMRAYYCLYLGKAQEAFEFANRALELNPNLAPAMVNRTLALHMLDKKTERDKALAQLRSPSFHEHYRAAAYSIQGDIKEAVHFLQRAIVLGRYTARDACKDVVFRILWKLPEFEEGLLPFANAPKLEYPFFDSCPPSEAEKNVRNELIGQSKRGKSRTTASSGRKERRH